MNWYLGVFKKYAVFTGRARRTEYWMFFLFNFLISFALGFIQAAIGLSDNQGNGPLSGLYSLAVLIPSIAVGVRRMHDTDHSGWWIIVPIANLVFLLTGGTQGPNRFGPDPKAPAYVAPASYMAPGTYAAPAPYGAPAPQAAPSTPAGWHPDPMGRHELRYWDSGRWTEHVSDAGVTSTDAV